MNIQYVFFVFLNFSFRFVQRRRSRGDCYVMHRRSNFPPQLTSPIAKHIRNTLQNKLHIAHYKHIALPLQNTSPIAKNILHQHIAHCKTHYKDIALPLGASPIAKHIAHCTLHSHCKTHYKHIALPLKNTYCINTAQNINTNTNTNTNIH